MLDKCLSLKLNLFILFILQFKKQLFDLIPLVGRPKTTERCNAAAHRIGKCHFAIRSQKIVPTRVA